MSGSQAKGRWRLSGRTTAVAVMGGVRHGPPPRRDRRARDRHHRGGLLGRDPDHRSRGFRGGARGLLLHGRPGPETPQRAAGPRIAPDPRTGFRHHGRDRRAKPTVAHPAGDRAVDRRPRARNRGRTAGKAGCRGGDAGGGPHRPRGTGAGHQGPVPRLARRRTGGRREGREGREARGEGDGRTRHRRRRAGPRSTAPRRPGHPAPGRGPSPSSSATWSTMPA